VSDTDHMTHALVLAARGLGCTWPNPSVGCVIVNTGRVVGRGFTQSGGRPHAEQVALVQAGAAARGATAYVTLEPCAHHGHTPPCADALIAAGVARVVTALTDPDSRVAGRGHAGLRAAGIAVTEGVLADAAREVAAGFLKRVTQGLPFVTLKLAATLDGRTATAKGESRWITGPHARRMVHAMRLSHDAVLIGAGTALADDPDLTARDIGAGHQPIRIVMDSTLRTPMTSRLARTARETPVWMVHGDAAPQATRDAWEQAGARLIPAMDAKTALRALADAGLTRILCEGGATLAASLLRAGLVDHLALFTAGVAIGADGHPALGPIGLDALKDAPRMALRDLRRVGSDTFSLWEPAR
jgi:diaminohydroxyphosphoribosylaminopyrimidine deaminase / 5-amino-6-(5-phosphoribosylamino)uracil reductase